ncbi:MAG: hypothetical protein AAF141_09525 [Pseudomonadota bacterium]
MFLIGIRDHWAEDDERFDREFDELVLSSPLGSSAVYADCLDSASLSAILYNTAAAAGLAITLFSAPATWEENFPRWLALYEKATEFMRETFDDFAVDQNTARVLAVAEAKALAAEDRDDWEIVFGVRHWRTLAHGYDDFGSELLENFPTGVAANAEATRQWSGRYIFGIRIGTDGFTVAVERDGTCSFIKDLP